MVLDRDIHNCMSFTYTIVIAVPEDQFSTKTNLIVNSLFYDGSRCRLEDFIHCYGI